jgi:glutathione synthase
VKTLYVMDPLDRIDVSADSTYMQMLEGCRRAHPTFMCTPDNLFAIDGHAWAQCTELMVREEAPHFAERSVGEHALDSFDVVWLRKDPPFDMDYVFSTYLLDLVGEHTLVLNDPAAIRDANEKMVAFRWPQFCVPTLVTGKIDRAMDWIAGRDGRVVLKPWDGNGGRGVLVSEAGDGNLRAMLELLTDGERVQILVQDYVEAIAEGDKRIILIDGEVVGWMTRIPGPDDHRGNMHVGAKVCATELTARDREICAAIGPWLKERRLLFVGIDVIGEFLTEINVTSPTGIQEINRLMSTSLEGVLKDAVERLLSRRIGGQS